MSIDILGLEKSLHSSTRLFGSHLVSKRQVFHETKLSFCLVNLKPLVPGHVLVSPKRCIRRFELLEPDEVADLWCTAQLVGRALQRHYGASSLTFTIQDGPEAGQTVEHVHVHVIPRCALDFDDNDRIYPEIETRERQLFVDHDRRRGRSLDVMAAEATMLRALIADMATQ